MTRRHLLGFSAAAAGLVAAGRTLFEPVAVGAAPTPAKRFEVMFTPAEWKQRLTPEQFYILRQHGTERAGTSALNREKRDGVFLCAGCDLPVFSAETKYESGTGWPSFWRPIADAVGTTVDRSLMMTRTEVHCRRCGGHLGHVFDDGPPPTRQRYCINGDALKFQAARV